jgi:ATP-grasp domain
VTTEAFRACLEEVAADGGVDAVLAVAVPTAFSDLSAAVAEAVISKPLAVALLDRAESVTRLKRRPVTQLPSGPHADTGPAGGPPAADPAAAGQAAAVIDVAAAITRVPCYADPDNAARALGHAVRYRAWRGRQRGTVPELDGLRAADARTLVTGFLAGGVEVHIGVAQEPVFRPLVVFGSDGVAAGVPGDQVARLTDADADADADAEEMIHAVRAAPLLFGRRGTPSADTAALADALLQVSRLADDLPEVSELDLNPAVARPDGVWCADVRVRISPAEPRVPFLRRLAVSTRQRTSSQRCVRPGYTGIAAWVQGRPRPGRGAVRAQARSGRTRLPARSSARRCCRPAVAVQRAEEVNPGDLEQHRNGVPRHGGSAWRTRPPRRWPRRGLLNKIWHSRRSPRRAQPLGKGPPGGPAPFRRRAARVITSAQAAHPAGTTRSHLPRLSLSSSRQPSRDRLRRR